MIKLDTMYLKKHILEEVKPIEDIIDLKTINFVKNNPGSDEGAYVYSDPKGYHFVYSERGDETKHKVTDNLFEITFWTIDYLTSAIAFELLRKNINKVESQRKYIFEQRLMLLEKVGSNYKKLGEIEIEEILKENPI